MANTPHLNEGSADIQIQVTEKKKGPLFMNLEMTQAKKRHEDREERRKNAPQKTILEMYRTIGAVNGPGWRPMPKRTVLETGIVNMDQK